MLYKNVTPNKLFRLECYKSIPNTLKILLILHTWKIVDAKGTLLKS